MAAKEGMQMDESGTGFAQEASLLGIPAEVSSHLLVTPSANLL